MNAARAVITAAFLAAGSVTAEPPASYAWGALTLDVPPMVLRLPPVPQTNWEQYLPAATTPKKLTHEPQARWFRCGCLSHRFTFELPAAADLFGMVSDAFIGARSVEWWKIDRTVDTLRSLPEVWDRFSHRRHAITRVLTQEEQVAVLAAFRMAADALIDDISNDTVDILMNEARPNLEAEAAALAFVPDVVVTFHGDKSARLEFDFLAGRALLLAKNEWRFYSMDEKGARSLAVFAEVLATAPSVTSDPTPLPNTWDGD